jgi:hypothetical protein
MEWTNQKREGLLVANRLSLNGKLWNRMPPLVMLADLLRKRLLKTQKAMKSLQRRELVTIDCIFFH